MFVRRLCARDKLFFTITIMITQISRTKHGIATWHAPGCYLLPTKEEVHVFARVCLSVCLTVSKITQKRVDGFGWNVACRQMSEHGRTDYLLSPIRIIGQMPEPDCFLRYRISAATRNFTSGKSHWRSAARASRGFKMVLFTGRRKTFTLSEVHAPYRVPF